MARQFIDARYEWNWSSLVGSAQGLLRHHGLPAQADWVSAVIGDAFRVNAATAIDAEPAFQRSGYPRRPLSDLRESLAVLGLSARVHTRDLSRHRPPWFLQRRLRISLNAGRPVVAFGAGVALGEKRTEFGLIVGYDDDRAAYRIDGPLTGEVGPWLPYDELGGAPAATERWLAVITASAATPQPERVTALARSAALAAEGPGALARWLAVLEGEAEIDAQRHAFWAQAFVAARGEAAHFWRRVAETEPAFRPVADGFGELAVSLSRFATLYPYPAGGDVVSAAGRSVGALALGRAITLEEAALATLGALPLPSRLPLPLPDAADSRDSSGSR